MNNFSLKFCQKNRRSYHDAIQLNFAIFSNDIPVSGAKIEAKDYRGRTPLLLAAELDRSVAASALMDLGASAKVCLCLYSLPQYLSS